MTLEMQVIGMDKLKTKMENSRRKLTQRKSVNARAVVVVDRWIQKNFQSNGFNVGGWKKLENPSEKRGGKSAQPLKDTGRLRMAWHFKANNTEASITSGVDYGHYHDQTDKKFKHVPQRRILPTNKEIWPTLKRLYSSFVRESFK